MVKISKVIKGSPADKAGFLSGDSIISIGGNPINDGLDYYFYSADARLTVNAERDGTAFTKTVTKAEYEPFGAEFETYLIDKQRRCRNNCIFCFIDQNPEGMRESIYFKDDDERMGFLYGNYVTLTNLGDKDIARIIKMHISPVNVSVHTMNPSLRCEMMGNRFAGDSLRYLEQLSAHGIAINAQLVLCPGINDGDELEYSMKELYKLKSLQSVSAVPVGITAHRKGLKELKPYTPEQAADVIRRMEAFADGCIRERGVRMFYASDEFYLIAGKPLPQEDDYDGYPQLENGVGMLRCHREEFLRALEDAGEYLDPAKIRTDGVILATGTAAYGHICELAAAAKKVFPKLSYEVCGVENRFFGKTVTVSGLVTGGDLIDAVNEIGGCRRIVIPCNMLRHERDLFLDGVSVTELEEKTGMAVEISEKDGADLLYKMLGVTEEDCI